MRTRDLTIQITLLNDSVGGQLHQLILIILEFTQKVAERENSVEEPLGDPSEFTHITEKHLLKESTKDNTGAFHL